MNILNNNDIIIEVMVGEMNGFKQVQSRCRRFDG